MEYYIQSTELTLRHFDYLWPLAYPHKSKNLYRKIVEDGTWNNLGGLLEQAISQTGKLIRSSNNSASEDFVDTSDAKLTTVRTFGFNKRYGAAVKNICNKSGLLRVVCYERKQDKFYYFLIENKAYKNIPKNSNIHIPFNLDGEPRRINKCNINWWDYEKKTFEEICIEDYTIEKKIESFNAKNVNSV